MAVEVMLVNKNFQMLLTDLANSYLNINILVKRIISYSEIFYVFIFLYVVRSLLESYSLGSLIRTGLYVRGQL